VKGKNKINSGNDSKHRNQPTNFGFFAQTTPMGTNRFKKQGTTVREA
jgi:hypothetical protein